jgi:hypothetical protein
MPYFGLNVKDNRSDALGIALRKRKFPKCLGKTQESSKKNGAISVAVRAVRTESGILHHHHVYFGISG